MQNTDFEETVEEKTKIFTIKTQVGKEQNTAELLNSRTDKSKIEIPSILVTPELRGYIFLESYDKERIKEMIKTVSYARNMLEGETAKVTHIDDSKEEITVELFESVVPIPITVRGEQVRVLKKREEDNKKEEKEK